MTSYIVQTLGWVSGSLPMQLLAQAGAGNTTGAGGAGAAGSGLQMAVLPLLLVGMYFVLIAPQMKRQKELKKLIEQLKTGDEVVTTGGIYGVITQVKADRFVVEIAKGTRVEVRRSHVEGRATEPAAAAAEPAKKS